FEITWHGAARPDRERHHRTLWQECRAAQQPRWQPAAEKRARRYTFDRHALPSRGRTHASTSRAAPATDVLRIAAAPTATEAIHRTGAPQERAQASGRRSRPRPSGSAMSAGSAPGAVPLGACGSILRTTNVHLRLTVVEMHVNAVPRRSWRQRRGRCTPDESAAWRPPEARGRTGRAVG